MFTGIIEATAKIIEARDDLLIIERPASFIGIKGGSSIAVSGVCLSVEELNKKSIRFSVVPETLRKSTIGSFKEGNLVNLERAMRADARLDGHIVQGHVEGVGEVIENGKLKIENETLLTIKVPSHLLLGIVPKGSIALDGVSLTVASINGDQITVALIPLTLEHTTLGKLQPGDLVNVETDVLARHASPPSFRTSRPAKKLSEVRVGIVYSQWYPEIVDVLRASAIREFMKQGIAEGNISEHPSPGSFEIPLIGRNLAQEESVDALIALGVIVEGETHHADLIAREAARGCMDIQVHYGIPFGFEILYVDDIALAQARRERGEEAARAVLAVLREKMEN
ncbi:MAG: riboflavin synthase [Patescibacteria group bacterium]